MIMEECKLGMLVYVAGTKNSISSLGGGSIMKSMLGSQCKIIAHSSNGRSVQIESETKGAWWFLPSDLRSGDIKLDEVPNIFHFDTTKL